MRRMIHPSALVGLGLLALLVAPSPHARAAAGCSLDDPERDLRRFFPDLTGFTTSYLTFERQAPEALERLEEGLGGELDPLYETPDVPYSLYTVYGGGDPVGYAFGVNQRGTYSNIQVIVATGPDGALRHVYLQKIRSPAYARFQAAEFLEALAAVPFEAYPAMGPCWARGRCDEVPVEDPSDGEEPGDFRAILRGMAKLRLVSRLLLKPGEAVRPGDRAALAERVASWWEDGVAPRTLTSPTFEPAWQSTRLPPDAPVLAWPSGGRIYPLGVLREWPVVQDTVAGEQVTAAWSPLTHAAVLVRGAALEATGSALFETPTLRDEEHGGTWSPVLGESIHGGGEARPLARVPGAVVMPWSVARRMLPRAWVLEPPAGTDPVAAWEGYVSRYGDASERDLLTVVAAGGAHEAFRAETLPESGVFPAEVGGEPVVLVAADGGVAAFAGTLEGAPLDLQASVRAPITGVRWVYDRAGGGLWEALTGRPVGERDVPLEPRVSFRLSRRAFEALFPGAPIH